MAGALNGIKVIDLTRVIAGPHCTMILGDLGAEVIKIEKSDEGDISRGYAPLYQEESTYFMSHNRNKKSITLNFRHAKAREILYQLIDQADVLVENYKAGTLEKMGLTPSLLLERNPGLIITRISGFGQTGPYASRPCFDAVAQSLSGIMDITGEPDGSPTMVGTYVCDLTAALHAVIGTLGALYSRTQTGKGQVVDVALLDSACALTHSAITNYYMLNQITKRNGNQDRASWPANFYPAKDGRMVYIHAGQDSSFAAICRIIGREDLPESDDYRTLAGRSKHIAECDELIKAWTMTQSADAIVSSCEANSIPCAKVNNMEEMAKNEQLLSRKMVQTKEDPQLGTITLSGPVVKMSATNPEIYLTPPHLGEHNYEIYEKELGLSRKEIDEMKHEGII